MNNAEVLSAILGQVMPLLVEIINSRVANKTIRYAVAMALSIVIGIISLFVTGQYSTENILASVGIAFISSQTAYHTWFKNSSVEKRINATFEAR